MIDEQWGHFLVGIRVQYGSSGAGIGYSLWTLVSRELPRCSAASLSAASEFGGGRLWKIDGPLQRSSGLMGVSFQSGDQTSSH